MNRPSKLILLTKPEHANPALGRRRRAVARAELPLLREPPERDLVPALAAERHRERVGAAVREEDPRDRRAVVRGFARL